MTSEALSSSGRDEEVREAAPQGGQTVRVLIETTREASQWALGFLAGESHAGDEGDSNDEQKRYQVHFGRPEDAITVPADRVEFFSTSPLGTASAPESLPAELVGEAASSYGLEERPDERLWRSGPEALSDAELVAVLIGDGRSSRSEHRPSDLELAREVISAATGLAELTHSNDSIVRQLGKAKATRLVAALEFSRRLARAKMPRRELLDHPDLVADYLTLRYMQRDQEIMGALYLDVRNRLIAEREIFRGTLGRAAVEPRTILKEGLLRSAHGFILFHTHPSGDPSPSKEDLCFTRRVADAAELVEVRLLDHMILGGSGRWVSLGRRGAC